jgi:hypothetical protein
MADDVAPRLKIRASEQGRERGEGDGDGSNIRFMPLETYIFTAPMSRTWSTLTASLWSRNVGEFDHNMIQRAFLFWFYLHEKEWGIRAI